MNLFRYIVLLKLGGIRIFNALHTLVSQGYQYILVRCFSVVQVMFQPCMITNVFICLIFVFVVCLCVHFGFFHQLRLS